MNGNMQFQRLMEMIFRALEDERAAAMFYNQMIAMAPNYDAKEAFIEARRDERQHAVEIASLIKTLTGVEAPQTMSSVPTASNFIEGLRKALEGEEMAIAFYTNIINMAGIESIRTLFKEIRQDEMVHAEKFRTLLQMLQGMPGNMMPTQSPMG